MLEQKSSGKAVAFDEQLDSLNQEWKAVIQDVEEKKSRIEKTAKKWWDFTRNKLKMIRWLNKKESDAEIQNSMGCSIDNAQEQMRAYQVTFDRREAFWPQLWQVELVTLCTIYFNSWKLDRCWIFYPFTPKLKKYILATFN